MDQTNPLLNSFSYLNEDKQDKLAEVGDLQNQDDNPKSKQLDTLIVDDSEESPNDEGTEINCDARECKHNVSSFCGRSEIQILINDDEATCNNYDPIDKSEEVSDNE